MAKKTPKQATTSEHSAKASEFNDSAGVTSRIAAMAHPMTHAIEVIRKSILQTDTAITEGVKWNSPSFYCNGWFATVGARKPDRLEIVLHHGAKVRADAKLRETMKDPDQLLKWAAPDRAILMVCSDTDLKAFQPKLKKIIKQWVSYQKLLNPD